MRNRTYGGVRGRKTKVGRKLLRFPPTRLYYCPVFITLNNFTGIDFDFAILNNIQALHLHP